MSIIGIKKRITFFLINKILKGTKYFKIKRELMIFAGYKIGINTKIVGPLYVSAELEIGDNCWIGRELKCEGNGKVIIGDNCDIAPNVTFLTGGHQIGDKNRRAGEGEIYTIKIGNGCWLCANSTLGKNITIGDSSIIAACACVMKSFGSNIIVGGVPSNIIRSLENENIAQNKK